MIIFTFTKILFKLKLSSFIFTLIIFLFGSSRVLANSPSPLDCVNQIPGDTNGDCQVDETDYQIWLNHYGQTTSNCAIDGNFNCPIDTKVNGIDFAILRMTYTSLLASPLASPTPTPTLTSSGIWISKEEIVSLPIAGQTGCLTGSLCYNAWNSIIAKADSSWGAPNLSDYAGLSHSQGVWAAALAAVRLEAEPGKQTEAQQYRNKASQALNDVIGTEAPALPSSGGGKDDGSLAISRQFVRYVTAADILGINSWGTGYKGYSNYVDYMLHTKFTFRVGDGGNTFSEVHDSCASNANAMSGGSRIVSAAYLEDTQELDKAWLTFRRYTGDGSVGPNICINTDGKTWFYANYDTTPHVGINPKNSTCFGKTYPADGVIPADQGRGAVCPSDPTAAPTYTQYPWEGLQGAFSQAVMLYRLGYKDESGQNPWQINDSALKRAVEYQWYLQNKFGGSWYDSGRAAWVKHLANKFYGFKPIQYDPSDGGRNMSHTQWTHP